MLISEISDNHGDQQNGLCPPEGLNWAQVAIEAIRVKM